MSPRERTIGLTVRPSSRLVFCRPPRLARVLRVCRKNASRRPTDVCTNRSLFLCRKTGSSQELFAGKRDQHPVHGAVPARVRRRTTAAVGLHGGHQRAAVPRRSQLQRFARSHGRRSDRAAAVHPVRGHGVREQREGPEPESRARLRGDRAEPEGSARGRSVDICAYIFAAGNFRRVPEIRL